jgi:mono/diheme cytochrome c family protein
MSPIGLDFAWRSLAAPRHNEIFGDLAVVKFHGRCDLVDLTPLSGDPGPLGWTHVTDGEVLPFSTIDCDRIRSFLGEALFRLSAKDREDAYGRAIARVLAHELYHVFTRTRHHGGSGVAQPAHSVRELMAEDFSFDDPDAQLLATLLAADRSPKAMARAGGTLYARRGCVTCHGAKAEGTAAAPALRVSGRSLDVGSLASHLAAKASLMYRKARGLKISFRSLKPVDVQSIVTFLNSPD